MFEPTLLLELFVLRMPFGKYKGGFIGDIPESYIIWYKQKGFPKGKLGVLMELMYEIYLNGLSYLLVPIRKNAQ